MADNVEAMTLAKIKSLLNEGTLTRIEFDRSWTGHGNFVRLYEHALTKGGSDKWISTTPALFGPDEGMTRSQLLRHLADLMESE